MQWLFGSCWFALSLSADLSVLWPPLLPAGTLEAQLWRARARMDPLDLTRTEALTLLGVPCIEAAALFYLEEKFPQILCCQEALLMRSNFEGYDWIHSPQSF